MKMKAWTATKGHFLKYICLQSLVFTLYTCIIVATMLIAFFYLF